MPYAVGDQVEIVRFPEPALERIAELTARRNTHPGWAHPAMTEFADEHPAGWQISKIIGGSYQIVHPNLGSSGFNWNENWLQPLAQEKYTVGQMLRALSRS